MPMISRFIGTSAGLINVEAIAYVRTGETNEGQFTVTIYFLNDFSDDIRLDGDEARLLVGRLTPSWISSPPHGVNATTTELMINCPQCGCKAYVIDCRKARAFIYRRRQCQVCHHRFTSYERIRDEKSGELSPLEAPTVWTNENLSKNE